MRDLLKKLEEFEVWHKNQLKLWDNEKREIVKDKIESTVLVNEERLGSEVINDIKNHESIVIYFKNSASLYKKINIGPDGEIINAKVYMERGSQLVFSQSLNGKIIIWMEYPLIDDLMYTEVGMKTISEVEVKDITADLVEDHIKKWISEVVYWKKNTIQKHEIRQIGFKRYD